jgi:preprotein translocase subunit SecF
VLVLLSLIEVFFLAKLNMGIDFAGGTQLIVRFLDRPELDDIREVLASSGVGEVQIQQYGEDERNEVLIRTPLLDEKEEGSRDQVEQALEAKFGKGGGGRPDLNQIGSATVTDLLFAADPDHVVASGETAARDHYREAADRVMAARRDHGLFRDANALGAVEGLSAEVRQVLHDQTELGTFSIVSVENVGPQIGAELRTRGVLAVVLSLLGMMAYIWWRFEWRFGAGAMIASAHDVIVTLGLYALLGYEFNLTTIAAFLTLVGYSVNDTVVIFDRVRENLKKPKRLPLTQVINDGINETLSRTIMTASTTMLAVLALFIVGGEVLRGLAFVLLFGIIVGTYSTIYVASAMVLYWQRAELAKDKVAEGVRPVRANASPAPKPAATAKASARRSSV